jgi:hypothetical protein
MNNSRELFVPLSGDTLHMYIFGFFFFDALIILLAYGQQRFV